MTEETRARITDVVKGMIGWCEPEKACAMYELIEQQRPALLIEIGVFGGRSLIPQAMALKANGKGIIYGIDPWCVEASLEGTNDPANDQWWKNNVNYDDMYQKCLHAVQMYEVGRHTAIMRCRSETAAVRFNNIDILHLDGNHSEEVSCRDVELWLPRVRLGGFLWFDDSDWPTTQKAQSMIVQRCEPYGQTGTCKLFKVR